MSNTPLIIAVTHHKCGTVLCHNVFRRVARILHLKFDGNAHPEQVIDEVDIFGDYRGIYRNVEKLTRPYRGLHMIRDPRNVVVSGYLYHLQCTEEWALRPKKCYNNLPYQEYLKTFTAEEGLIQEMLHVGAWNFRNMKEWNYNDPNFIEIRYEELMEDFSDKWKTILEFVRLPHASICKNCFRLCMREADKENLQLLSAREIGERNERARKWSGPNINHPYSRDRWKDYFTCKIKDKFKDLYGDILIRFGYEQDHNW